MSDTSQGPGWWLASDGRWYPPEMWTGPPGTAPPGAPPGTPANQSPAPAQGSGPIAAAGPPAYGDAQPAGPSPTAAPAAYPGPYGGSTGAPYSPHGYPASPYGSPTSPYGYGPTVPYGAPATRTTNGFAIASLVCSCAGLFFFGVPSILGIIFGFVARSQIRRSNGTQKGNGLALAGIIVGFAFVALALVVIGLAASNSSSGSGVVQTLGIG